MLVNYKNANMLVVEMGDGKQKLMLVPGINVLDDKVWEGAKATLDAKIRQGIADYEAGKVHRMHENESSEAFLERMISEG